MENDIRMENNFIYSDRGEGKTEFITKLANRLHKEFRYKIDFCSLTKESIPKIERGITYDIYKDVNSYFHHKRWRVETGKVDILFIDDINFLDNWIDLLSLDCIKYITVNMPDKKVDEMFKKLKNKINYNLFSLSDIQHNDFLKPYLRDEKLNILLND